MKFNLMLSESQTERLQVLKEETEAASLAEVIRHAINVYDALHEHNRTGWEIILRDKAGKKSEKVVLLCG